MAKLKTTTQTEPKEVPGADQDSLSPRIPSVATPTESSASIMEEEIPAFAWECLKVYPQYKTLYIDNHGGVFSSTTPEVIRGSAKLYENPFYQP
ncbi:MAG: hypothetical protein LUF04_09790 [Bacteroides sp.]|nr:hypothetical protein [Bacteroides sp.]